MVDLALSSMGLVVYARTQRNPLAAKEAASKYYRLLRVAQARIAQVGIPALDGRNIDACLLAIFLMGRYEGATHRLSEVDLKGSFTSLWSHHDGAMAILKVWNEDPNHDPGTFIIKQTRRGLMRSSLLRNLPLPDWLLDGDRFGEHDGELDYDRIAVRVVNLHYASASLEQRNGRHIAKAEELDDEARELDEALQAWAARFPSTWSYQRLTLPESDARPRRHFYSSIVYSYSRVGYAAVWSQYFATRMLINSIRLRVLRLSRSNPLVDLRYQQQRSECTVHLKAMSDGLASSVPFCLERFKIAVSPNSTIRKTTTTFNTSDEIKPYLANLIVWPLTIASSLEGIDVRQQLWFRSELAGLGRITGIGVLECAETNQWAIL